MRKGTITAVTILSLIFAGCSAGNSIIDANVSGNGVVPGVEAFTDSSASDNESSVSADGDMMPPAAIYTISDNMSTKLSKYDQLTYYNKDTATIIEATEEGIVISGEGAFQTGNDINLVEEGTYIIKGIFENNSFKVNGESKNKYHVVLENAQITCNYSSPVYASNGDKLIITVADNTDNMLNDSVNHANDAGNGTIYSEMDVAINGNGNLTIEANYSNGIVTKKDIKISGAKVTVNANNNGIKGNSSVTIIDSNIVITAKGDGIKTTEEVDKEKGFVFISGSVVEVTADDDVIQATNACVIRDKSDVRGRCYGSLVNCTNGFVEGEETIVTWE